MNLLLTWSEDISVLVMAFDDEVAQFWAVLERKRNNVQHGPFRIALGHSSILVLCQSFAELISYTYIPWLGCHLPVFLTTQDSVCSSNDLICRSAFVICKDASPILVLRKETQPGCVNDQGGDRVSQLRMIDNILDLLKAFRMVRQEAAWYEVAVSSGSVELCSQSERLEIFGCKIAADALFKFQ
jgi:hypothetical protein